ncbi:snoaL-like domain containing protein [Fusarium agapanthi]|uniref:SnoaL-like domain containing protein n=1 Tax=Fusarium agapanthi TaxID=1803897 RepID=A0A9P5B2E4_9HYPO|nr:snoaL-like domain containing protein [Fusarium agapanthi]
MSYVTENTIWLSDKTSQSVKDTITRFYQLADSKQADAGPLMATEVFSPDGVLHSPNGTFTGASEISKSRDNAWSVVTERRHIIQKAFGGNDEESELVLLGSVHMKFSDGQASDSSFAAHVKLEPSGSTSGSPHITFMEVYAASVPLPVLL